MVAVLKAFSKAKAINIKLKSLFRYTCTSRYISINISLIIQYIDHNNDLLSGYLKIQGLTEVKFVYVLLYAFV